MALCDGTSDDSMLGLDDDDKDIQIWYNLNDNENSSSDSASDHLRQFFHIEPTVLRPRLQRSRHNGDTRERRRDTVQRQAAARRQMRILQ